MSWPIEPWPIERRERLLELVAAGLSAREAGERLGCTRNAILGYAHRNGIKFPVTAEKSARCCGGRPKRQPTALGAPRGRSLPPDHPIHRRRERGARAFTDAEIATAIAARLAGLSMVKAARMAGAGAQSLAKNWLTNPDLMAAGQALFEQAKADAAVRARQRQELEASEAETRRITMERTNWPILGRMPGRHREIMERRIAGQTLQEVGNAFGVTRERIRQIEVKWRSVGLIVPRARELTDASLARLGWHPPQRRGPKVGSKSKTYRMSDAERARRAEHMRGVSRAYWDARA